jgi:hypothetical protein
MVPPVIRPDHFHVLHSSSWCISVDSSTIISVGTEELTKSVGREMQRENSTVKCTSVYSNQM